MAIRILHVVEALGVGGGVENGIANLIARMDSKRFEHILCAVFHMGSQLERYPLDRVRLVSLGEKLRKFSTQVRPLGQMIRETGPDIVHSRNWGAMEAVFAGRWAKSCAVVHSEHGVELNPAAEPRRRSCMRRAAFEMAHHVFSVSYQLREVLANRTGFSAHRMGVIHNGVDTKRFRRDAAARLLFRKELGIPEEFCIGCVGRLSPIKDYATMLRAAETFGTNCPSWRLLIAGDGTEAGALRNLVESRPALQGRVQFLGTTGRIPELLNAVDVYALTSVCEGISNSLLEAMAAGLPVIASDTGGNPELVVNGETGLLFPVGDYERLAGQIGLVYRDKDLRERLGRESSLRAQEEFSLDSMVRNYENMYADLAESRATGKARAEKAFA